MKKEKIRITGILYLIKESVRIDKKKVSMPIDTWKLIEVILERIKLEVPKS